MNLKLNRDLDILKMKLLGQAILNIYILNWKKTTKIALKVKYQGQMSPTLSSF